MLFLGITAIQDAVRGEPHYIPLVVSLSNHERLFDRLRANGLVLFSEQWLEPISIAVRCLFVMTVSSSVTPGWGYAPTFSLDTQDDTPLKPLVAS